MQCRVVGTSLMSPSSGCCPHAPRREVLCQSTAVLSHAAREELWELGPPREAMPTPGVCGALDCTAVPSDLGLLQSVHTARSEGCSQRNALQVAVNSTKLKLVELQLQLLRTARQGVAKCESNIRVGRRRALV